MTLNVNTHDKIVVRIVFFISISQKNFFVKFVHIIDKFNERSRDFFVTILFFLLEDIYYYLIFCLFWEMNYGRLLG